MSRRLSATICVLALSVSVIPAQTEKTYLLPSVLRLSGVVTDGAGNPLPEVWISHTGLALGNSKTDSNGRFEIETRAPAIVFRKGGFQSRYLRIDNGHENSLAIILAGPAPQMKSCNGASGCISLEFFGGAFCLPKIRSVHVSKQGNDVDYGCRSLWITTPGGNVGVQHCSGGLWGSGFPFDQDVWSASEYTEAAYQDREGFLITDARGKSPEGKYWRVLGHAFETVSYRRVSAQDGAVLDRVIDGACIKPARFGLDRHK